MIFQSELTSLQSELSQLEMMLTAKRQELGFFQNLQTQTDECLEKLSRVVNHARENTASGAIASLKTAVLTLFADGDGGNDGGTEAPTDPTPDTNPTDGDEVELLCLNGITGECLTTADIEKGVANIEAEQIETPSSSDVENDANTTTLNIPTQLEGQCCDIDAAPLKGQYCTIPPSATEDNDNKSTSEGQDMAKPSSTEMIHLSANCGYLKLKADGRILAAYCWFSRKNIAEAWVQQLEVIPSAKVEMRESKRNSSWKWELKVTGLNVTQIERLSKEPLRQKPKKETPAQAAGIETPSDWRKPQVKEELPLCPFGIGDIAVTGADTDYDF